MVVAGAALAFGEVIFQIGVAEGGGLHRFDGGAAEGGAAKIGVEDDTGGVDDGLEGGGGPGVEDFPGAADQGIGFEDFAAVFLQAGAGFVERGAEGIGSEGAAEFGDQVTGWGEVEEAVNGGEVAEHGIGYQVLGIGYYIIAG